MIISRKCIKMYFREIQLGVIGFKDYEEIEISPYSD